jgi:hypothetical protein
MGYPHILAGNDGSRSTDGLDPTFQEVAPVRRGGSGRTLVAALGLILIIGTLVAKPWERNAVRTADATVGIEGASASASPPTAASAPAVSPVVKLATIEPDRWARLSASLRATDADGVVFVGRDADGLFYDVQTATPSGSAIQQPARTDGSTNTVRGTGLLGNPVAIGFTRPTDAELPVIIGWQFRDWADQFRLPLTHPIGDVDRYLFIGTWLPRGEQNIREISRQPPQWQGGTYEFDFTVGGQTRYLFVILDP